MVESLFERNEGTKSSSTVERVTSMLPSLSISSSSSSQASQAASPIETHALTILARVLKDPLLTSRRPANTDMAVMDVLKDQERIDRILKYTGEWLASAPGHVDEKVEELAWMNVLMYGVGGFIKGKTYTADFFL
jgi:hypothetical protein